MDQHEMAIEELARGQECATKLQELLLVVQSCKTHDQLGRDFKDGSQSFMDLTEGMLKSFTNTLSILNFGDLNLDLDQEVSQVIQRGGASADGSRSEESDQESSKLKVDPKSGVAYKRRKNTDSRYIDSPICNIDGHAWRKYGQKEILKSKYPRNYFRCTHKNEQGCQATKQVQKIQEDPPLYRTTYFGQHSCRNLEKDAQLIFDNLFAEEGNSKLLSFSNNNTNTKDSPPFSSFASAKCKFSELEPPSDHLTQNQSSSTNYYYVPSHMPEIFDHGLVHNPEENFSKTASTTHSLLDDVMLMDCPAEFGDFCT